MNGKSDLTYLQELISKGAQLSVSDSTSGSEEFDAWLDSICRFRETVEESNKLGWLRLQDSLDKNKIIIDKKNENFRAISSSWKSEAGTITYLLQNILLPQLGPEKQTQNGSVVPVVSENQVVADDSLKGLSSRQRQLVSLERAFGKLHLLSVGIDQYSSASHFGNLKTCTGDAEGVRNVFADTHQLNADKLKLKILTSKTADRPSRGNIILKLRELANGADETNRILYFHSGHGAYLEQDGKRSFYLVPEDAYADDDPAALISLDDVKAIFSKSAAKQKLIILDSCWSGPEVSNMKGPLAKVSAKFLEEYLKNAKGVAILSACAFDQAAYTDSPSPNLSLFTYFLIRALSGQAPEILDGQLLTLSGLSTFLSVQVQRTAKSYHRVQLPGVETSHQNEIIVGNFMAPIVNTDSWDPAGSPVDGLKFSDSKAIKVTAVLTKMTKWNNYSDEYIEKMVNSNLDSYLEEQLGESSADLCSSLGFNHRDVIPDGCTVKFPGGTYTISYEARDKRAGALIHEVRFGNDFLVHPNRIPIALEALNLTPSEMTVELSEEIDPLSTIPGLQATQWQITSQRSSKVVARHKNGCMVDFSPGAILFSGFSPSELWGSSTNKVKASLVGGVMALIGK